MEKRSDPGEGERRRAPAPRNKRGFAMSGESPWNYPERRKRPERRLVYDRRQLIRFEEDRRTSMERRVGTDPWGFP